MLKVIINDLSDTPIEQVQSITERAIRGVSLDQQAVFYYLELIKPVETEDRIKEDMPWIMELESVSSIKVYDKDDNLINTFTNYNTVQEMSIETTDSTQTPYLNIKFS